MVAHRLDKNLRPRLSGGEGTGRYFSLPTDTVRWIPTWKGRQGVLVTSFLPSFNSSCMSHTRGLISLRFRSVLVQRGILCCNYGVRSTEYLGTVAHLRTCGCRSPEKEKHAFISSHLLRGGQSNQRSSSAGSCNTEYSCAVAVCPHSRHLLLQVAKDPRSSHKRASVSEGHNN